MLKAAALSLVLVSFLLNGCGSLPPVKQKYNLEAQILEKKVSVEQVEHTYLVGRVPMTETVPRNVYEFIFDYNKDGRADNKVRIGKKAYDSFEEGDMIVWGVDTLPDVPNLTVKEFTDTTWNTD